MKSTSRGKATMKSTSLLLYTIVLAPPSICAFVPNTGFSGRANPSHSYLGPRSATALPYRQEEDTHFLLEEFCTHSGEVVNPYSVLNVSREAERSEVRKAYLALSKRYHPDVVRHQAILPGGCNTPEEARDEWERIKLSYEILSDRKTRLRYNRHEMIADPTAAMGRAAVAAVGRGLSGIGQGIFQVGAFAIEHIAKDRNDQDD